MHAAEAATLRGRKLFVSDGKTAANEHATRISSVKLKEIDGRAKYASPKLPVYIASPYF